MTGYSNGVVATVHNSDWPDYDVTADTSSGSLTYYEVEHTSRQSCCSIVPTSILLSGILSKGKISCLRVSW